MAVWARRRMTAARVRVEEASSVHPAEATLAERVGEQTGLGAVEIVSQIGYDSLRFKPRRLPSVQQLPALHTRSCPILESSFSYKMWTGNVRKASSGSYHCHRLQIYQSSRAGEVDEKIIFTAFTSFQPTHSTTAWSEAKVVLTHDVVGGVGVVVWDMPGSVRGVECEGEASTGATMTLHDCTI